ncbi:hypothetical protein [Streptomyces wuyuanensis]|uniref:hypothetical protein n=1 Tax=Streptomyces wuyuanensis TaxID=1196353 RepID=UPI0037153E50
MLTTFDVRRDKEIAYDAIAVQPINGALVERTLTAAAIFDPNQNIDTSMPTEMVTPLQTRTTLYHWAQGLAHKDPYWDNPDADVLGISGAARCPTATPAGECSGQKTWDAADAWYKDIKAGGIATAPDSSAAPSMSIPIWMAMANKRLRW